MDADKPIIRINPAQDAFDKHEAAIAAQRARRTAENDALSSRKPGGDLADALVRARFATSQ